MFIEGCNKRGPLESEARLSAILPIIRLAESMEKARIERADAKRDKRRAKMQRTSEGREFVSSRTRSHERSRRRKTTPRLKAIPRDLVTIRGESEDGIGDNDPVPLDPHP
jgi:hypothetical protein